MLNLAHLFNNTLQLMGNQVNFKKFSVEEPKLTKNNLAQKKSITITTKIKNILIKQKKTLTNHLTTKKKPRKLLRVKPKVNKFPDKKEKESNVEVDTEVAVVVTGVKAEEEISVEEVNTVEMEEVDTVEEVDTNTEIPTPMLKDLQLSRKKKMSQREAEAAEEAVDQEAEEAEMMVKTDHTLKATTTTSDPEEAEVKLEMNKKELFQLPLKKTNQLKNELFMHIQLKK